MPAVAPGGETTLLRSLAETVTIDGGDLLATRALADGRLVVTVQPAGTALLASSARASYSNAVAGIAIAVATAW